MLRNIRFPTSYRMMRTGVKSMCLHLTSQCCTICRQSRRVLVQLLEYDPMALQPSEPGFGSGSGKPAIMFGFLKHLWNTAAGQRANEQQQQALFRRATRPIAAWFHGKD